MAYLEGIGVTRTETGGKIIDVGAQGALYVYFALVLFDQKQIN